MKIWLNSLISDSVTEALIDVNVEDRLEVLVLVVCDQRYHSEETVEDKYLVTVLAKGNVGFFHLEDKWSNHVKWCVTRLQNIQKL